MLLLMTPFIFYVLTLYMGQSIIFIPHLTPPTFEWTLFNVRYGVMMVPAAALFVGFLFYKSKSVTKLVIAFFDISEKSQMGFILQFSVLRSLSRAALVISCLISCLVFLPTPPLACTSPPIPCYIRILCIRIRNLSIYMTP